MASIQDIANAAHRIGSSSREVQMRTIMCADSLKRHVAQLRALVQGSRTGEQAVQQVDAAEREVRQCAAQLLSVQASVDQFVQDLTK